MSKAGVYDQLISEYGEKFTLEEAQYAIDNLEQINIKGNLKYLVILLSTLFMPILNIHIGINA